jgi:hypothetical protein
MLLLLVQRIPARSARIPPLTIAASAGQITTIPEFAAAELTAARLSDNLAARAKKAPWRGDLAVLSRNGSGGDIGAEGAAVLTIDAAGPAASTHRGGLHLRGGGTCTALQASGLTVTTATVHDVNIARPVVLPPLLASSGRAAGRRVFRALAQPAAPCSGDGRRRRGGAGLRRLIEEFDSIGRRTRRWRGCASAGRLTAALGERRRVEAALHEREGHIRLLLNSTARDHGVDVGSAPSATLRACGCSATTGRRNCSAGASTR